MYIFYYMFQTDVVEKIKTHILCSVTLFSDIVPFMTWCRKIPDSRRGHRWQCGACVFHAEYLGVETHPFRICNAYCFSTATVVAGKRLGVRLYVQSVLFFLILSFLSSFLFHFCAISSDFSLPLYIFLFSCPRSLFRSVLCRFLMRDRHEGYSLCQKLVLDSKPVLDLKYPVRTLDSSRIETTQPGDRHGELVTDSWQLLKTGDRFMRFFES
jgi:hypothetical protein